MASMAQYRRRPHAHRGEAAPRRRNCAPTSMNCSSATAMRACATCRRTEVRSIVASTRYRGRALRCQCRTHSSAELHPGTRGAPPSGSGVRIFEGTRALDFNGRAPVRVRTRRGRCALPATGPVRQCLPGPHGAAAAGADHGRRHLHRGDRAARAQRAPRHSSPTMRPSPT